MRIRCRVDGPSGAESAGHPVPGRSAGPTSRADQPGGVGCEPFRRLRLGPVSVRDSDRSGLCVTDCFVFISVSAIEMLARRPRSPECIRLTETHQNMTDRPVVSHLRQGQTGASLVSAVCNKKRENVKKLASAVSMIAASALVLSACGSGEGGDSGEDYLACMVSDSGGWDDQSFNQSGREGMTAAKKNLGVEEQLAESQGDADFGPNVDNMVQQGCNLTFGVGFLLEDTIQEAAEANPDLNFALIDSTFSDADGNPVTIDN